MMLADPTASGREAELAAQLARDLDGTFEAFVLTYQDAIVGFVGRMMRDTRGAQDVAQDTFVRAYRALRTYDSARIEALHVRPWLFRIAANLTRNALRTQQRAAQPHRGEAPDTADPAPQPSALAIERVRDRALYDAVARLPASRRIPLVLRYFHDFTYDDIAQTLGGTPGAARVAVHRALTALRDALPDERIPA